MPRYSSSATFILVTAIFSILITSGCTAAATRAEADPAGAEKAVEAAIPASEMPSRGATITITPNGPADTVRAFYQHLRENRIREAIFLTNLRPAIEGLTDTELKEFQLDFAAVAKQVPSDVEINGEIITGDIATVTAKLPDEDNEKLQIQEVRLRKDGDVWVILTVDEAAEKQIRKEGKNYFYALKIETHQDEAREMLDRVSKAQIAFALQNNNLYGDMQALIAAELLPADIQTSRSTGYNYAVSLSEDRKSYSVSATPAEYGKTGRLSFLVKLDEKMRARLTSEDNGGKAMGK